LKKAKPFLRWVGGKTKLISHLIKHVPADYMDRNYFEPFLGAGSFFLSIHPKRSTLSDLNKELINCFLSVKNRPQLVKKYLLLYSRHHSKRNYYKVRKQFNSSELSFKQAARFLYLNKTSYNGIFRVNSEGEYNTPYGYIKKPVLPVNGELTKISRSLRGSKILNLSYEDALDMTGKGDFLYIDPPYPPLNGTAFFNHYTTDRFDFEEHEELAERLNKLKEKKRLILISNAAIPKIRKLYKGWNIVSIPITRWVSCKSERIKVKELIIKNY
jgi:DNA adenine methylase